MAAVMMGRFSQVIATARTLRAMSTLPARKLEGKVAVVTASTDGIGYAIADRLMSDGAKVVISSRKEANVSKAVEKLQSAHSNHDNVYGTICHVGNEQHRKDLIQQAISHYGGLDILVSNAAVNPHIGPTLDATGSMWNKIFDVNVTSTALLVKEAYPHMRTNGGSVVFIASIAGYNFFNLPLGPYAVSKTALLGLTKVLAQELGPDNIRVNCVAPGLIKTNFSSVVWESKECTQLVLRNAAINRMGEPEEISGIVSLLCSSDGSYITGESFVIAGGSPSRL